MVGQGQILWRLVGICSLLLLVVSPWLYASASWSVQWWLFVLGLVLGLLLLGNVVGSSVGLAGNLEGGRVVRWRPPAVAWVFLVLGCFAQVQSLRWWDADLPAHWPFSSISLQQWALGFPAGGKHDSRWEEAEERVLGGEEARLAISVEPMTTRGASSSLFLSALLVWGGSVSFGYRKDYPWLLVILTVLGVLVGAYGLFGAFQRQVPNLLGLVYGRSFSVFVSRNSAGAFLNIALAASLGLSVQRFLRVWESSRGDRPQGNMSSWPLLARFRFRLKQLIEHLDYRTQVVWMSTLFLVFCVPLSLCRGAFLSALAALFGTIALCWPEGGRRGGVSIAALVTIVLALLLMVFLQVDQGALQRMESIESIDFSEDQQAGRLYIWGVSWRAAMRYGLLGSGLGTFHVAALPFQSPSSLGWYYHAESMVAEAMVTLGWLGFSLCIAGCIAALFSVLRIYVGKGYREYLPLKVAGIFFLISQFLHACIDFAWILPGVYIPSCLMLGALSGASVESQQARQKILDGKRGAMERGRKGRVDIGRGEVRGNRPGFAGIGFALVSVLALWMGQSAVGVLSVAEGLERRMRDAFEYPEKSQEEGSRVERRESLVDRWMDGCLAGQRYGVMAGCMENGTMLRLLGQSIVADLRYALWERRPGAASSEQAWSQTSPVVMRLALEDAGQGDRDAVYAALGGDESMRALSIAERWFRRGQLASPLDWRLVWGRVSTSVQEPIESLEPYCEVLSRVSSHVPGILPSVTLLYHRVISEQERQELWRQGIRVDRRESLNVARVMSGMYVDGQIPLDVFPEDARILRSLYNEIFTQEAFPLTHGVLGERLMEASQKLPWTGTRKALWMSEVARETGDSVVELENLELVLQLDRDNVPLLKRVVELLLERNEGERAREYVKMLTRLAPKDPFVERTEKQLMGGL